MKHLTRVSDMDRNIVEGLMSSAIEFRSKHSEGSRFENILGGKVVAMIFEKPSLRTKVAFEVATASLGGCPVYLTSQQILESGNNERGRESVPDIARNLERFADLLLARVYSHAVIEELSSSVDKPVVNALCDLHHPTQSLADLMAIRSHFESDRKIKVSYIGDGNNVATSLLQICSLVGYDFMAASPESHMIPLEAREVAESISDSSSLNFVEDPREAVESADVVYTDTFVSMGQEGEKGARASIFAEYQVSAELMGRAKDSAIFMHCLPAHRGEEVTDEVMDSKQSIVFDQAECRLHIAKALLQYFLSSHHSR